MPNNDGNDIDIQDIDLSNGEPATLEAAKKRVTGILTDLKVERKKRQDLESRLQAIEDKEKLAEQDKLKEQGKLQELVNTKDEEIKSLKSEISNLKVKADEYDLLETQERESAKKKLGDKYDPDYDTIPIKTLRKITEAIVIPNAINTDNGSGAHTKTQIVLTEAQKKERDMMFANLTDEKERTENYIYAKGLK